MARVNTTAKVEGFNGSTKPPTFTATIGGYHHQLILGLSGIDHQKSLIFHQITKQN
jgi:hypothetical protein